MLLGLLASVNLLGWWRNVLRHKCYVKLPESLRFPLHEDGSQVFVADGHKTGRYGTGTLSVRIGKQDVTIRVALAGFRYTWHGIPDTCRSEHLLGLVPIRILKISETMHTIGAQAVVAVAKPVTGVSELELPELAVH